MKPSVEWSNEDAPFLGRDEMVCLIEDTPTRWHAYPAVRGGDVEVQSTAT